MCRGETKPGCAACQVGVPGIDEVASKEGELQLCSEQDSADNSTTDEEISATPESRGVGMASVSSQRDFRAKYLQKLTASKVLVAPKLRPPKHQTMIIFDWDDTLLCTTALDRYDGKSETTNMYLKKIAETALGILEVAASMGHTFIITNAQTGWVEHSAKKWAPKLLPVLKKVQVISARDGFHQTFPHDVDMWKISTFLEVRKSFDSEVVTNLIAVGDSHYEMNAAFAMAKEFEYKLVKTIKFQPRPTPAEMLRQLELVAAKFGKIVEASRNMSIVLERKPGA